MRSISDVMYNPLVTLELSYYSVKKGVKVFTKYIFNIALKDLKKLHDNKLIDL